MIDTIADDKTYKKVIAQQVQQVYPTAVGKSFNTLPNVFQSAISIIVLKDSLYVITLAKSHPLKIGDQLELKCEVAGNVMVQVENVKINTIIVKSKTALNDQKVFVYGTPSNDVLTVDYDALSMLNISATQELAKTIEKQQQLILLLQMENKEVKLENQKLKEEQATVKTSINDILTRVTQLEASKEKTLRVNVTPPQK